MWGNVRQALQFAEIWSADDAGDGAGVGAGEAGRGGVGAGAFVLVEQHCRESGWGGMAQPPRKRPPARSHHLSSSVDPKKF